MQIRAFAPHDLDAVICLSLRAWDPVFDSMQQAMNPAIFRQFYPDWRAVQERAVTQVCGAEDTHVWVAVEEATPVGFVAVNLHRDTKMGEIYMIAVDPDSQRRGVGAELTEFALNWIQEAGMKIAMVETGADPGHSPARRTYEKAGFELLPVARYYKELKSR